jgi:2'-5' RNA ligase
MEGRPGQLSLFGAPALFRPIAPEPDRPRPGRVKIAYFLAVLPTDAVRRRLTHMRRETVAQQRLFGRCVAAECLHVTLAPILSHEPGALYLGEAAVALVDAVMSRVAMSPFKVCFDSLQTFRTKKAGTVYDEYPLVLCGSDLPGLARLHDLIRRSRARFGIHAAMPAGFTPHVTLFYGHRPIAPQDVPPIRWTVHEVALVQSFQGQGRHVILKRWPLDG